MLPNLTPRAFAPVDQAKWISEGGKSHFELSQNGANVGKIGG